MSSLRYAAATWPDGHGEPQKAEAASSNTAPGGSATGTAARLPFDRLLPPGVSANAVSTPPVSRRTVLLPPELEPTEEQPRTISVGRLPVLWRAARGDNPPEAARGNNALESIPAQSTVRTLSQNAGFFTIRSLSAMSWRSAPSRLRRWSLSTDSLTSREGFTSVRHATAHLLEQVSSVGTPQTFLCPICMENIREDERIVFGACGNADHGCCRHCMSRYLRVLIADGRVSSVACPKSKDCGASATVEEVRRLCDAETLEKYERFRRMRQDPTLRQCPSCALLCKPALDGEGGAVAEMHCQACGTAFCYYHSNAHPGRCCQDYQREVANLERASERTAMQGSKLCPSCKMATVKISGCNHMTCANCQCDWCWVCGALLDNISWHFNPGNPSGCQQFQDSDTSSSFLFKTLRCCMAPVSALSIIIFFILSLGIIFWGPVLFALVGPCVKCRSSTVCMAAAICTFLPFLVWQCAWMIVASVLHCFTLPCGARGEHFFFLLQVPFASVAAFVEGVA